MPEPTFLSVDIDYFNIGDEGYFLFGEQYEPHPTACKLFLEFLLEHAVDKNIPIEAVMNHDQMLVTVNQSSARQLVNIDMHSDLADKNVDFMSCGTWVSFVKWRTEGSYLWVRNEKQTWIGECGYSFSPQRKHKTDWKAVSTKYIKPSDKWKWLNEFEIVGISVCMSPQFSDETHIKHFREWCAKHNVPYRKGILDESNYKRPCQPPCLSR